jgi:hypothetical protein
MPKLQPATDSATQLHDYIGDDATATFEDDPKFVDSNPTGNASTENVTVQRDTDDTEENDDEFEDDDELEDEDEEEDEDDEEEEDEEDEDDEDEEDDADEVKASPALRADGLQGYEESEEDDDEDDIDTGVDEDDLDIDDMDTDKVAAAAWVAASRGTLLQHLSI